MTSGVPDSVAAEDLAGQQLRRKVFCTSDGRGGGERIAGPCVIFMMIADPSKHDSLASSLVMERWIVR